METFKVGDIVRLRNSPPEETRNYGYIIEIKPRSKFPWNIQVMFFGEGDVHGEYGAYTEKDLVKVSDE
jgi:hypothetical protein